MGNDGGSIPGRTLRPTFLIFYRKKRPSKGKA